MLTLWLSEVANGGCLAPVTPEDVHKVLLGPYPVGASLIGVSL